MDILDQGQLLPRGIEGVGLQTPSTDQTSYRCVDQTEEKALMQKIGSLMPASFSLLEKPTMSTLSLTRPKDGSSRPSTQTTHLSMACLRSWFSIAEQSGELSACFSLREDLKFGQIMMLLIPL